MNDGRGKSSIHPFAGSDPQVSSAGARGRPLLRALVAMLAALALLVAACGTGEETEEAQPDTPDDPGEPVEDGEEEPPDEPEDVAEDRAGGTLVLSYLSEPDTLDPHRTVAPNAEIVLRLIGGSLVEVDPDSGDLVPAVLDGWEVSDDGREWTLSIRPGVTFASGEPLTAEALQATWERGLGEGSTIRPLLGDVEEFVVVDDRTLLVRHAEPLAGFDANLASTFLQPIDPEALALDDEDLGQQPASVGPYVLVERVVDSHMTLRRNANYAWPAQFYQNQGPAYPDEIVVRNIREDATRMAALETGEVHVAILGLTDVGRLLDHPDVEVGSFLRSGVSTLAWINHESEPLDDVRVRQAINHAIDRETIVDLALDGHGEAAYWPIPPWSFGYSDDIEEHVQRYDPDQANALLDEAGWEAGADGIRERDGQRLSIVLFSQAIPAWERASQIMQANLLDAGIELEIEVYDGPTMRQYSREGRHDLSFLGYGGPELTSLYTHFHSSQIDPQTGWNFSNYRNPELDALLEEQATAIDEDERLELAAETQRVMVDDAAFVPLFTYRNYWGAHSSVQGFRVSEAVGRDADAVLLHDVWLEER